MKKKKREITLIIILAALFIFLLIRSFSSRHLDDLHPDIPCEKDLIEKSGSLAVIPLYNNKSIAENKEWCQYISGFNKTLILHGVYHTYNEFNDKTGREYFEKGTAEFEKCFGYKPTEFKPPQLAISGENMALLKEENFKVHTPFSQIFHKVYHCNDSGILPNWIIDLI